MIAPNKVEVAIAALLALPPAQDAPPRRPAWCARCGAPVTTGRRLCEPCGPEEALDRRREGLAPAAATLPPCFDGRVFGSDALAEWVKSGTARRDAQACVFRARVLLCGASGRGKTSLAVAMARELLSAALQPGCTVETYERAKGLRFIDAAELEACRARFQLGKGDSPLEQEAMRATVLLLDDLGQEDQLAESPIRDVIWSRYKRGKDTWVTTGFPRAEIARRRGDGFARRVVDGVSLVNLGWPQ